VAKSDYQHHFVVVGQYNEAGDLEFSLDDDTCQARFDSNAIYVESTGEWVGEGTYEIDEELLGRDTEIYQLLEQKLG